MKVCLYKREYANTLKDLLQINSPSGREYPMIEHLQSECPQPDVIALATMPLWGLSRPQLTAGFTGGAVEKGIGCLYTGCRGTMNFMHPTQRFILDRRTT